MPKRKKDTLKWIKETLELTDHHNWQAKPGCKVFVAGRGAVRFDVPQNWHFEPDIQSFKFWDRVWRSGSSQASDLETLTLGLFIRDPRTGLAFPD